MRINRLIAAVVIVGLVVLTSNVMALEPAAGLFRAIVPIDGPPTPEPGTPSGPPTMSDTCPATNMGILNSAGGSWFGDTTNSNNNFGDGEACDNIGPALGLPTGPDEIFEFTLDGTGLWVFDTCTGASGWDTTLYVQEETGGGCPGDPVACNGDDACGAYYESALSVFLFGNTTYYLVVDGWSNYGNGRGTFEVTYVNAIPACNNDADCDDGLFCTGVETCNVATGECSGTGPGRPSTCPCTTYEGYCAPCDEATGSCPKPEDWLTWKADTIGSGYFFPQSNNCPDFASWLFDDIQGSHHTTGVLDFYTTPIIARSTPGGISSPLGTVFLVNQALFTTTNGTCIPEAQIAGSQCTQAATIDPRGAPPHLLPCSGTMPELPNNAGDFGRCEIDFWMAYRSSENGQGMLIAGNYPELGGLAGTDDFGVRVIALEDCPPTGDYTTITFFGDDEDFPADFELAEVCQKPGGACCHPDGSCSLTSEGDCDGDFGATGTINGTDGGCGGDPDGDGLDNRCGDNCEDDFNPGQEDCDGDGIGDACDTEKDKDGDGVCDSVDNCPNTFNPGQESCDGGSGDACDLCPCADPDDADNDGVCDDVDICLGFDDNDDADNDGVPGNGGCNPPSNSNGCDCCPDHDDGITGSLGDDDGDGVLNCNDQCNGVDDAVFAPECDGRIPTVSEWGLVVLALLLLVAGKVYFGRRESLA